MADGTPAFAVAVGEDVLRVARPGTRWLSTGHDGGVSTADAAYNVTVPEGFDRTDLDAFLAERFDAAGVDPGPALLTGVAQRHARGARSGSVTAVATAGLSNPATLPTAPTGDPSAAPAGADPPAGTVNLLVGTRRALAPGTLASLLATVVEAKTATLLATTGFTGTTSDAVVVGTDPDGAPARFAGSATDLGADARACVRAAVRASCDARYADERPPPSVAAARHGVRTDRRATTFSPNARI
ncbi:MAG: adenosylcobinamide amidohydrolase [Haloarculaceae archaeon]